MAAPTSLIGKILLRLWLYQGSGTIQQTQLNKTHTQKKKKEKREKRKTRQQKKAKYASGVQPILTEYQWGVAYC